MRDVPAGTVPCGFIAGTRVHTDRGLVAIEDVREGDRVLSRCHDARWRPFERMMNALVHREETARPEDSGVLTLKRVVRTFIHRERPIRQISYSLADHAAARSSGSGRVVSLFGTDFHPFWVEGAGWMAAGSLEPGQVLPLSDGTRGVVQFNLPVTRTRRPGVGWTPHSEWSDEGTETDFSGPQKFVAMNVARDPEIAASADRRLKVTIFNLEVEDGLAFHVGGAGIRVRGGRAGRG